MSKVLSLGILSLGMLVLPRTGDGDAATLTGAITNENNVVIAGAKITARNNFSGLVETANSNVSGVYEMTGLPQGRYSAFVTAEGYGCVWAFNIFLHRGEKTRLDFTLVDARKKSSDCS